MEGMSGQDWLNYFAQNRKQPAAKGIDYLPVALNLLQKGAGLAMPFNLGFAGGGIVNSPGGLENIAALLAQAQGAAPPPQEQADPFAGVTPEQMAGPPPQMMPLAQPTHPRLEAASAIIGNVLQNLPAPRPTRSSNKTIGAYLPALGAAVSGPGAYAAKQRAAKNAPIQKANDAAQQRYQIDLSQSARDLANERHRLTREKAMAVFNDGLKKDNPDFRNQPLAPEFKAAYPQLPKGVNTTWEFDQWQQQEAAKRLAAKAATDKSSEDNAIIEQTAQDIAAFNTPPELSSNGRALPLASKIKSRVNELLKANGSNYTYDELVRLSKQQQAFQGNTANSQRFSQLRQSAVTVAQHLKQYEDLYSRWNTYAKQKGLTNFAPTNAMLFAAARSGALGPDGAAIANALGNVTSHALAREVAYVLSGGYAPYEQDVKSADNMLSADLGPKANKGRIDALRSLLNARIKNALAATPYATGRNGKPNPYLLEPSPLQGWEEAMSGTPQGGNEWTPPGAEEKK